MTFRSPRAAFAAALLSAAALGVAALPAHAQSPAPATPPAAAAPAPGATDADPVLARVNGIEIKKSDLTIAEDELGGSLPPQLQGPARQEYVLGFLIDLTALAQSAEADKLDQAPEFAQQLAFAKKRLLMQAALSKATKAAVSDAELKKTYDEALKQQKPEEEVRARHILFRVEDPKDEKASAAAEAKAKDVEAKLKKGEDFAKLASALTEDPSGKENGGDLGYFTKDQMVPEFADKAFAMKPGEVSEPVKTQFGWHVIKLEDKRQKPMPSFDEVKPQIEQFLAQKAQAEAVQKVRDAAKVEKTTAAPSPADLLPKTDAPKTDAPAAAPKP
jgi:peptidyl-prolyl cis-trans isomerase C